jgi:hypothetical protein
MMHVQKKNSEEKGYKNKKLTDKNLVHLIKYGTYS